MSYHESEFGSYVWQKPFGLLSLLDEESTSPRATDLTFEHKMKQNLNGSPCFNGEREGAFQVCHFSGAVSLFGTLPLHFKRKKGTALFCLKLMVPICEITIVYYEHD